MFMCENGNCHDKMSYNTHAVYLPIYNASSWESIFLDSISDIDTLIGKLLDQLPSPQELSDNDFEVSKVNSLVCTCVLLLVLLLFYY